MRNRIIIALATALVVAAGMRWWHPIGIAPDRGEDAEISGDLRLVMRVYDVRDLANRPRQMGEESPILCGNIPPPGPPDMISYNEGVINIIANTINVAAWSESPDSEELHLWNDLLIVRTTLAKHREIQRLLEVLRKDDGS